MDLASKIRNINDFPQKGVVFRDITTLLKDSDALREAVDSMGRQLENLEFDYIAGAESRGFIFAVPLAYNLKKGFIPIRKAGKLPAETVSMQYDLEYGAATIEMHKDAIKPGDRVVIVDDLMATGGTAKAMAELIESVGGIVVSFHFLIELKALGGRKAISGYPMKSILEY